MANYYDKYLEEYKKRMNVKERWKKHMTQKEKGIFWRGYIIFIILTAVVFGMAYTFLEKKVGLPIYLLVAGCTFLFMYRIIVKGDVEINKIKDDIALRVYEVETWEKKNKLDIEDFKQYLRDTDVKTEKQIVTVLEEIDKTINMKSRLNTVAMGGVGVFCLPIWTKQIDLIYVNIKTIEDGIANFMSLCILVTCVTWAIKGLYIVCQYMINDMRESKYSELEALKKILLEMHLESMREE